MFEIEIKAKIRNRDLVISKLKELGVVFSEPIVQDDSVYFPNGIDMSNVVAMTPVQRIRIQNGKAILTLKLSKSEGNHLDKIEYESEISNPDAVNSMLTNMGFYKIVRICKERLKTKYDSYEICIDKVKDLGEFIELEFQTDQEVDTQVIQEKMWDFLESLSVSKEDKETLGYDMLILKNLNYNSFNGLLYEHSEVWPDERLYIEPDI